MQNNWRIGSLLGIPLYINSSWLIIVALITISNASDITAKGLAEGMPLLGWLTGLAMALLLFASVLLHELGHSLTARSQGIKVNSITLFLFGGVASIDRESQTPGQAFQVAIAGPIVSFLLFGLFAVIGKYVSQDSLLGFATNDLSHINLILAIFNLIPGLPLDGGQVLKALVWKISGDRFTGIRWAAASGKFLGLLAVSLGVFLFLASSNMGALWISLIGWFVVSNANNYERITNLQELLLKITAAETMNNEFRVVNANLSLREFTDEYLLFSDRALIPYYAASEGRYRGLIKVNDLQHLERSQWDWKKLHDIAHPLTEIPSVIEKTPLVDVINQLEVVEDSFITVISPAGAVSGVIDRGDIVSAIAKKQNLPIPDQVIKQIKAQGVYPPGFPLNTIAQTLKTPNSTP